MRRVIVLGPTPSFPEDVPSCVDRGRPEACDLPRRQFEANSHDEREMVHAAVARHGNAHYIEVADWLCSETTCPAMRDGVVLYTDSFHVTATAATQLAGAILDGSGFAAKR